MLVPSRPDLGTLVTMARSEPGKGRSESVDSLVRAGFDVRLLPGIGPVGWLAYLAVRQWRTRSSQAAKEQITYIDLATAEQAVRLGVRFPYGHPMVGYVYARHPADQRRYIVLASFHREILTEKTIEGARLLLALGARDVSAEWASEQEMSVNGGGEVDATDLANVTAKAGFVRRADGQYSIAVSGASGGRRPLPDLTWLAADPAFQLAVDAADSKATSLDLIVRTEGETVVNAEIAIPLQKLGLRIGGDYKKWEAQHLALRAEFEPTQRPIGSAGGDVGE